MTGDDSTSVTFTSGERTVRLEVCARCGHMTPTCDRCGQSHLLLGGYIDGKRYCHSFARQPSCYTLTLREAPRTLTGRLYAELVTPVQDVFDEMLKAAIERYNAAYPMCSTLGCSQPAGHPPPCDQRAGVA